MITIESNQRVDGNEAPTFGSFAITLLDDESATMKLPFDFGHVLVAEVSNSAHGMAWMRGSSAVKYAGGANFTASANVILTGTTGVDGQMTVSSNANNFYIENRTGATVNVSITFLGIAANRI